MQSSTPVLRTRLGLGCALLSLVVLAGTVGFTLIEGWTPIQALFTTMLVVSTLGFSDRRPSGMAGELLTIVLIAAGVGTLYYLVGAVAQNMIESQLDRGRRRSMDQQINRLKDHFIVCGYGRVGQETCRQLRQQKQDFVVIDSNPERVKRIEQAGYLYVIGDASDDAVLQMAGIMRARALLTAVQSDAANVYITLSARALNPRLVIVARAATNEASHKLSIAGANRVISPYVLGGRSMASMALRPAVMELIDLLAHGDELGLWLEELRVEEGSALEGTSIVNTRLREEAGITILAVRQFAGKLLVNPGPDYVLQAHDTLIVLGSSNGIDTTIPFVRSGS